MDESLLAADVSEVAEGFGIPHTNRAIFCADLTKQIEGACRAGPNWRRPQPYAWLGPIAKQAADLRDSLLSLGVDKHIEPDKRRETIEARFKDIGTLAEIGAKERTGSGINIQAFLGALDAVAERGAELSASQHTQAPQGRGRPKKALPWHPGASAPEELVAALYGLVAMHGGEPPTFYMYNDAPAGTLYELLVLLRPHLPNGFVDSLTPKVLRKLIEALEAALVPKNS